MMIATGTRLREELLTAHEGERFIDHLTDMVHGAPNIPHGIEEMAWDAYPGEAGWPLLLPRVLFSVHRSLLAGRDSKDLRGLQVTSEEAHALDMRREEVNVGKSTLGSSCRRAATRRRSTARKTPLPG